MTIEGEVHFLDAVALGARTKLCFGTRRRAAEKNEINFVHSGIRVHGIGGPGSVVRDLPDRVVYLDGFFERPLEDAACARGFEARVLVFVVTGADAARFLAAAGVTGVPASPFAGKPAFNRAARSMILASISPASPPLAGRFDVHTS